MPDLSLVLVVAVFVAFERRHRSIMLGYFLVAVVLAGQSGLLAALVSWVFVQPMLWVADLVYSRYA